MATQEALKNFWLQAPEDRLCAREQAKAWALRELWREEGKGDYGLYSWVAGKVKKTKNGKPNGDNPTNTSMKEFFDKIDDDGEWFPGKHTGGKRGPKRVLTGVKVTAIVSAAKRLKAEGEEPTYSAVVAACPVATLNPATGEPVDKALLYTVLRESCYDDDDDPEDTWDHRNRLARGALDEAAMLKRDAFAIHVMGLRYTEQWYFFNLVWCDLCNSIVPRTQKKAQELALARKGGKGWMSKCSQQSSENYRLPKVLQKLNSSDTVRIWWVPILSRGKLHIEPLPGNFPGETQEGAATMVERVRAALNIRFQGSTPPKVLFTDRGNGFYHSGTGAITDGCRNALRSNSLKAFFGEDASVQPGKLQEIMLHETSVAWMRLRLAKTLPRQCWTETIDEYRARLRQCAAYVNDKYDVDGLCRGLLKRVEELHNREGDRISM